MHMALKQSGGRRRCRRGTPLLIQHTDMLCLAEDVDTAKKLSRHPTRDKKGLQDSSEAVVHISHALQPGTNHVCGSGTFGTFSSFGSLEH